MVRFISIVFFSCLAIIFLCKIFFTEPLIKKENKAINPRYEPIPALFKSSDTLDIHLHYQNITAHLKKPFFQDLATGFAYRSDEAIQYYYYYYYTRSSDAKIADIGYLALTILNSRNNRENFALENLAKISNKSIPYYLQEKSYLNYRYGEIGEAEKNFREAISKIPDSEFAQTGLIKTLYSNRNYIELSNYLSENTLQYYPEGILMEVYFHSGRLIDYYKIRLKDFDGTWIQILAALMVTATWLVYLFKINISSSIPVSLCLLTFLLSLVSTLLCDLPYQFYSVFLDFKLRQTVGNDFLYSIFGIGLIEETMKLIPLVIVLFLFRKKISEPYHYLVIASTAALGFSFLENIMYFKLYPDQIIYIRSMVSVTVHLFCTTLTIYGAMIISNEKHKVDLKYGLLCFLAAIVFHGLFDVVLINDELTIFSLFSYALMAFAIHGLNKMYNYALNISPNYVDNTAFNNRKIRDYLFLAFTGIFFFEFVLGSVLNGYYVSYDLLVDALMGFIILLAYIATGLSDFSLIYGYRTGILKHIKNFDYPDLLNTKVKITLLDKTQLTSVTHELYTNFRVSVKNEVDYILSSTDENNLYDGFFNLLLVPYRYTENKKKAFYSCRLFGIESDVSNLYNEQPTLKLLGKFEVVIPGKETPPPKTLIERINKLGFVFIALIIIITLVYYMNYKSARQAYRWTFDFLDKKVLYKANNNIKYAIEKDGSYSEAYLLGAKLSLYIHNYGICIKQCKEVTPNDHYQYLTLNYLLAKSNFDIKNYQEAEKYFDKLLEDDETRDSAYFYKAQLYIRDKKYSEALTILEKTFPVTTDDSINFMKIKYLIESEKYSKADTILNTHLVKSGRNLSQYYYWNGFIALSKNDTLNACRYFTESEKLKYMPAQVVWGMHCYSRYDGLTDSSSVKP